MSIPSINLKDILEDNTDLVYKQTLFIGQEPTAPNDTVTLFDTPDRGPFLYMREEDGQYEYNGVQARIRNARYDKGMERAREVSKVLHNTGNIIINGIKITLIEALENPFLLDWDDNDRARFVVNFAVQQTETT